MAWISTKERLPTEIGKYRIRNNAPECNNGEGESTWLGEDWDTPEMIKSFFRVLYWWE